MAKLWETSFDRASVTWTARLGDVEATGVTEQIAKAALASKLRGLRLVLLSIAGGQ